MQTASKVELTKVRQNRLRQKYYLENGREILWWKGQFRWKGSNYIYEPNNRALKYTEVKMTKLERETDNSTVTPNMYYSVWNVPNISHSRTDRKQAERPVRKWKTWKILATKLP